MSKVRDLLDRLTRVLENRSGYASARELEEACAVILTRSEHSPTTPCQQKYISCFQMVDLLLLSGALWKAMEVTGFRLEVICNKPRVDETEPAAKTEVFPAKRLIVVHIRLPGADERAPKKARHVGGVVCQRFEVCVARLLLHEFVHVVELFIRLQLGTFTGFSLQDSHNVVFQKWLLVLFSQRSDANAL